MANHIMVVERVGEIDLLQQALAGAVDDYIETPLENQQVLDQTELLNILQGDNSSESPTYHITPEQAVALGLRLEEDTDADVETNEQINIESESIKKSGFVNIESDEVLEVNEADNYSLSLPIVINSSGGNREQTVSNILKNININPNKPLGTEQNPIQLIQEDGILKSVQHLSPEQLADLEILLQSQDFSNEDNKHEWNIFSNPSTKTRIVYRTVQPENNGDNVADNTRVVYRTVFPEDVDLEVPRRGRPRGRPKNKKTDKPPERATSPEVPLAKAIRTRSGRITKPPKHKHFRPFHGIDIDNLNIKKVEVKEDITPSQTTHVKTEPVKEPPQEPPPVLLEGLQVQKRNILAQHRCPTCKKAYVGFNKMMRHLKMFPDHGPLPIKKRSDILWTTAVKLARSAPPESRGITLLNYLEDLINNIQKLSTDFLQPPRETGPHYDVNEDLAALLRVPPGKYSINESVVFTDSKEKIIQSSEQKANDTGEINSSSNTDSIVLPETTMSVDTGQEESMIVDTTTQSDDMISVDQLVNERLDSLTAAELVPPLNNTASTLSLDLSLDLFQFNST